MPGAVRGITVHMSLVSSQSLGDQWLKPAPKWILESFKPADEIISHYVTTIQGLVYQWSRVVDRLEVNGWLW